MSNLLEFRQPSWTFRRFAGSVLDVASRIDRIYGSIHSVALSCLAASCAVRGLLLDRASPSEHLPVTLVLRRRCRWDPRVLSPLDRRVFEDPQFYRVLALRVQFEECVSVEAAQEHLVGFKAVVREVAAQRELWCFRDATATPRDQARLATRAQATWAAGRLDEVCRLRGVWPALCRHFDSRGGLRDERRMVEWVFELVESEATAEMVRLASAATPEWQKAQARERVRQRAARWCVRRRRVTLQGLISEEGEPLVDRETQGREISRHWGRVFAAGVGEAGDADERE